MKFVPHDYQSIAMDWIRERPYSVLMLDMGLGKTVVTLTVLDELLIDSFQVNKILVVAPKKVAESTWPAEIKKWDHLRHLRISQVLGSASQRERALKADADIYIINRDNVIWLVEHLGKDWDFDCVVLDELSSFKNPSAKRFRALRKVRPLMKRVIGLTGTPMPNGYLDLWSQLYLIDRGERLEKTVTAYRAKYFRASYRPWGNVYVLQPGAAEEINSRLKDICLSMKAKDYLRLPEPRTITVSVRMTDKERRVYDELEREYIAEIAGKTITAGTGAVLTNKLLQLANGAVYNQAKKVAQLHDQKLEALEELIEAAAGEPVLVCYWFKHDRDRIKEHLKMPVRELETPKDIEDWNAGRIPVLLAHPGSCGHGLNLQDGGHIVVWFGLTWSLELYEQAIARLQRQGQLNSVRVYHIITEGTVDEEVLASLQGKKNRQEALLEALKARIARVTGS